MNQPSLRNLARRIEDVAREHPCYSQIYSAIGNLSEYLLARARIEELNRASVGAQQLTFEYTNWKNREATRRVRIHSIRWGVSEFYKTPTWLLMCWDLDKNDFREFNLPT